jgi:hypothetical protein
MVIWIDVHPTGENLIHTTHMLSMPVHVRHSYVLVASPRTWQPFMLTQQSWTNSLLLWKSAPDSPSQPDWVARGTCLSVSPKHNHWSSALKPNICWWICYIGLLGPCHQHVISTFNTCSRGPTHRNLIDTREGYNLGDVGLPHHTLRPSQPMVLCFLPKVPAQSQVKYPTIINCTREATNPKSCELETRLNFYHNLSSKHSNY